MMSQVYHGDEWSDPLTFSGIMSMTNYTRVLHQPTSRVMCLCVCNNLILHFIVPTHIFLHTHTQVAMPRQLFPLHCVFSVPVSAIRVGPRAATSTNMNKGIIIKSRNNMSSKTAEQIKLLPSRRKHSLYCSQSV